MKLSLALHLVGIVLWMGSLIVLTRIVAIAARGQLPANDTCSVVLRFFSRYTMFGMGLTLVTGFYQLMSMGMAAYMKQGWFHGKLTLVIIAVIATLMFPKAANALKGVGAAARTAMTIHGIIGLCLIIIVTLTISFRFGY